MDRSLRGESGDPRGSANEGDGRGKLEIRNSHAEISWFSLQPSSIARSGSNLV